MVPVLNGVCQCLTVSVFDGVCQWFIVSVLMMDVTLLRFGGCESEVNGVCFTFLFCSACSAWWCFCVWNISVFDICLLVHLISKGIH